MADEVRADYGDSLAVEAGADESASERWVTKQQLADHLQITRRWVESQQRLGLPHLRLGSINRYRVTEVEAWLRERYAAPRRSRSD